MGKILKKFVVNRLMVLLIFMGVAYLHINVNAEEASNYCGAEGNEENVTWNYDVSTKTLSITGTGEMINDSPVGGYPWTKLKSSVNTIIIGDGVTNVGAHAFEDFAAKKVIIGNTVEKIDCYAFFLSHIESIVIPGSVKEICIGAFRECFYLEYVILDDGVEKIDNSAFERLSGYGEKGTVYFPSTITFIGDAFGNDWQKNLVFYGKNDVAKNYFEDTELIYVDATEKLDLSKATLVLEQEDSSEYVYTGEEIKPINDIIFSSEQVKKAREDAEVSLIEGVDYTIDYSNNIEAGEASCVIKGIGCYEGEKTYSFSIYKPIEECTIEINDMTDNRCVYDGKEKEPKVSAKYNGYPLNENKDYKLSYSDNINEGTAKVIIEGEGDFKGRRELEFEIYKIDLMDVDIQLEYDFVLYDGTEKKPKAIAKYGEVELAENEQYKIEYSDNVNEGTAKAVITGIGSYKGIVERIFEIRIIYIGYYSTLSMPEMILYDGTPQTPDIEIKCLNPVSGDFITLEYGKDYELIYSNNIEEGTAEVRVRGIGSCSGEIIAPFTIYKIDLTSANIQLEYDSVLYNGNEKTPKVIVKYGEEELAENQQYTIKYLNNVNEGTAKAVITGVGSYKGTVEKAFSIYKYDLGNSSVELPYSEVLYDGTEKKPEVTVKYAGNVLEKNSDYTVSYVSNVDAGEALVTVTGKGRYKGTHTAAFSIYKYDFTKAVVSLSYNEVLCDGSEKKPEITVAHDGKMLEKDKDYTVTFKNNIMPGTALITLNGNGQYSGVIEKSFEIEGNSIKDAEVSLKESIYSYDGSPKKPSVEVKLNDKILSKDTDYVLTYEDNIDDGTANAVITGTGMFIDVVKVSFVILPYNPGVDAVYPDGTMIDGNFVYGVMDDETNEVEVFCPASKSISKLQIPATITDENGTIYKVTSIGNKAFYKNTKLTSVTIGNNVKSIEDYAFYGCKNIKTLKIGKNVDIIGNSAFRKCTKLTSVTLPKSIDSLGKNAFYGCSKLKSITINANSVIDVKANAIKGISKKAVIKVPKKLVKKYKKEFNKKSGFKGSMKIKKK